MGTINARDVMNLRKATGAGMMACKKVLVEAEGDFDKAIDLLRKKGIASAAKKAGRETENGKIGSYIHMGGKIGVLVELACETDFVADTDDFAQLLKDVAMHIAAANPAYLDRDSVPKDVLEKEMELQKETLISEGKPAAIIDKIVEGKLNKFYERNCLIEQPFIKDDKESVGDLIKHAVGKLGENIKIIKFARFEINAQSCSV